METIPAAAFTTFFQLLNSNMIIPKQLIAGISTARPDLLLSTRRRRRLNLKMVMCRSRLVRGSDYDPYELLGVARGSGASEIKEAYRSLQKRCHPDIAGPAGHDMAIILNQAYSMLSDPETRSIYDKELVRIEEFQGYTGKPMYSVWKGSEDEDRAVFVDELKCVGCLKCALIADQTFGIESTYGRARVVAQWADPSNQIEEAIQACPVDCITLVKRSDLPALEFLMSKQPRGNVTVGVGSPVGTRVANVFVDVNKFKTKFKEMQEKASASESQDSRVQREAREAAIDAIRSILGLWSWNIGSTSKSARNFNQALLLLPAAASNKKIPAGSEKLREAAARRHAGEDIWKSKKQQASPDGTEYWTPNSSVPQPIQKHSPVTHVQPKPVVSNNTKPKTKEGVVVRNSWAHEHAKQFSLFPMAMAGVAAIAVGLEGDDGMSQPLTDHFAGPLALELVNSLWMQVLLAASAWYVIGQAVVYTIVMVASGFIQEGSDSRK